IGICLIFTAWLLVASPDHRVPNVPLAIALTCSIALTVAIVTGVRAARHRSAALLCSGGTALAIAGLGTFAMVVAGAGGAAWFVVAGAVALPGPLLIL